MPIYHIRCRSRVRAEACPCPCSHHADTFQRPLPAWFPCASLFPFLDASWAEVHPCPTFTPCEHVPRSQSTTYLTNPTLSVYYVIVSYVQIVTEMLPHIHT